MQSNQGADAGQESGALATETCVFLDKGTKQGPNKNMQKEIHDSPFKWKIGSQDLKDRWCSKEPRVPDKFPMSVLGEPLNFKCLDRTLRAPR